MLTLSLLAFVQANPPETAQTDISLSQFLAIQEKGVSAWEFEPELEIANCFVEARTEIEFFDSECSVQSNLPVPKQNEVYYWEAKIYDKPETSLISIGMTTKPYPLFRLPGMYDLIHTKAHGAYTCQDTTNPQLHMCRVDIVASTSLSLLLATDRSTYKVMSLVLVIDLELVLSFSRGMVRSWTISHMASKHKTSSQQSAPMDRAQFMSTLVKWDLFSSKQTSRSGDSLP